MLKEQLRSLHNDIEFMEETKENEKDIKGKKGFCLSFVSIAGVAIHQEMHAIVAYIVFYAMEELLRLSIVEKDS